MAWLGMSKTPEEFAAGHPNHPFARPGIHFVPKRSSTRVEPPVRPAPEEKPPLPEEPAKS